MSDTKENETKKIEKILGEPFMNEFPEYVRKIRNNLIFISLIAITINWTGIHLSEDSSFLGLKFDDLKMEHLQIIILILNFYFLIHFFWCSIHNFIEWRLRLTGTKLAYTTAGGWASEEADHTSDLRQSTLHNWWRDKSKLLNQNYELINDVRNVINKIYSDDYIGGDNNQESRDTMMSNISNLNQKLDNLSLSIKNLSKTEKSKRIDVSLKRFDNWYRIILKSQNLRWVFLELSLPLIIGAYSTIIQLVSLQSS